MAKRSDHAFPPGYEHLRAEVSRIEGTLSSIGAVYRGCNAEQIGYAIAEAGDRGSGGYVLDLDDSGELVLPDVSLPSGKRLLEIREELSDCARCGLGERRDKVGGKIVFGSGSSTSSLVIIGEAPGKREEGTGEPFVGPAGEMLDRMLQRMLGLSRQDVYVINVLKCRPEMNRDPNADEMSACRPFLDAQLSIVAPKVILTLGAVAIRALMGRSGGIHGFREKGWFVYRGVLVKPTFHPSYLLRLEGPGKSAVETTERRKNELIEKGRVKRDLEAVKDVLSRDRYRQRLIDVHSKT